MLTYLATNNNNESIQRVSDEDKRPECEYRNTLCVCMELGDKFLKRNIRGQQNPTLIVGRLVNLKRWNYFLPWTSWINGSCQRDCKAEGNNQLCSFVLPQIIRWLSPDRFSRNFILWNSIKIYKFCIRQM